MKLIDLAKTSPTLPELLRFAGQQDVLLETREGRRYVVAEIDDFDEEIAAVVRNKALMRLLTARAKEKATVPLAQVRARLNGSRNNGKSKSSRTH